MTHPLTPQPHFKRQKYLHYPYKIGHSLVLNDGNQGVLYKDDGTAAGSQKYTFSGWFKFGDLPAYEVLYSSSLDGGNFAAIYRTATNQIGVLEYFSSAYKINLTSTEIIRDYNNWFHLVVVMDTTQAVAANRIKIWINNHQCTLSGTFPAVHNGNYLLPDYYRRGIGRWRHLAANWYDGLMTEVVMLADQALTPSSFGQDINGVWVPKSLHNINFGVSTDIYLRFNDVSSLPASMGYDESGNDNTFLFYQPNTSITHLLDSPTNNYPKFDILKNSLITHALGGVYATTSSASAMTGWANFGVKSGKWYWEGKIWAGTATILMLGICGERNARYNTYGWQQPDGYFYYSSNGKIYNNDDGGSAYGASYTTNDIIGIAFDADVGTLEFFKNNASQGTYDITAHGNGLDGRFYFPAISDGSGAASVSTAFNFGQFHGGLTYSPPAGFKTLCAENLPEPRIRKPEKAIDILTWTGDGESTKEITGLTFQPDIVWIKDRDSAYSHLFSDSVKGPGHAWWTNSSVVGDGASSLTYGTINSFNPNGITVNKGSQLTSVTNESGESYIAWCLKALPQYGIDIVSYTGTGAKQAIAHDLGVVPNMIIVKNFGTAANNNVYQDQLLALADPWTDISYLDLTNVTADSAAPWADTAPTTTHFTVGTQTGTNGNGDSMMAYLFANVPDFSHVFRYYGNASTNGPVVRLNFKPRFVIFKNSANANNWWMFDSERDPINPVQHRLYPSDPAAEATGTTYAIEFWSNGFKIRSTTDALNKSANWIFGIAFAERPFKYSNAVL